MGSIWNDTPIVRPAKGFDSSEGGADPCQQIHAGSDPLDSLSPKFLERLINWQEHTGFLLDQTTICLALGANGCNVHPT